MGDAARDEDDAPLTAAERAQLLELWQSLGRILRKLDMLPAEDPKPTAPQRDPAVVKYVAELRKRKGIGRFEVVPPSTPGVYAVTGWPGWIKIGRANNIASRVRSLQTGHHSRVRLIGVLSRDPMEEHAIHAKWAHLRERGEWFRETPELLAFIVSKRVPKAE